MAVCVPSVGPKFEVVSSDDVVPFVSIKVLRQVLNKYV
jgi:hypothetical protein